MFANRIANLVSISREAFQRFSRFPESALSWPQEREALAIGPHIIAAIPVQPSEAEQECQAGRECKLLVHVTSERGRDGRQMPVRLRWGGTHESPKKSYETRRHNKPFLRSIPPRALVTGTGKQLIPRDKLVTHPKSSLLPRVLLAVLF